MLLTKLFSDFYPRKIVYLTFPTVSVALVLCALVGSKIYFFVCALSFFFCFDSIGIPSPDISIDLSKFFIVPVSKRKIYFFYLKYRYFQSLVLNMAPSGVLFFTSLFFIKREYPTDIRVSVTDYTVILLVAWIVYVLISTPLVIMALRESLFYSVIRGFCYPFFMSFLVSQLQLVSNVVDLKSYNALMAVLLLVLGLFSIYAAYRLIKNEQLFPAQALEKRGI